MNTRVVHFQFLFYFLLVLENSVRNGKKILATPPRRKKTLRGRYRRRRWVYFNFHYFFLVIMIFRYFYWAPQISVRNYGFKTHFVLLLLFSLSIFSFPLSIIFLFTVSNTLVTPRLSFGKVKKMDLKLQ